VGGSCWQGASTGDASPYCCCWDILLDGGGGDGDGDVLYSELVGEISSSARVTI